MKAYGGVDIQILVFLTSVLVGGEWSASSPARFTARERAPLPIGYKIGWVPVPVWTMWRRENTCPYLDLNPDPSVLYNVAHTHCGA
jgi:hypothetical protein